MGDSRRKSKFYGSNEKGEQKVVAAGKEVEHKVKDSSSVVMKRKGIVYINEQAVSKSVSSLRFMSNSKIIHVEDSTGKLTFERKHMWVNEEHATIVKNFTELSSNQNTVPLTCYGRKGYPHNKAHIDVYNVGITKYIKESKKKEVIKYVTKKKDK